MKIFKFIIFAIFLISNFKYSLQQCNITACGTNQILDCVSCQCIPNLNCSIQPADIYDCKSISCNLNATLCPKKCYCDNPSILNSYCQPCLNGGIRNYSNPNKCACSCPTGYQGDRCQFSINPCLIPDTPDCANINCYNTTEANFYGCQRKCLCCSNEQCNNLGLLTVGTNTASFTDYCSCSCINSNFSPQDNCLNPVSCVDLKTCGSQFGVYPANQQNCNFQFIAAQCPYSCGLCTP